MIAWHASSRWHCRIFHSYLLNFQLPDDFKVFLWMRYMLVWSIIIIMLQNLFAIHTHHFCITITSLYIMVFVANYCILVQS